MTRAYGVIPNADTRIEYALRNDGRVYERRSVRRISYGVDKGFGKWSKWTPVASGFRKIGPNKLKVGEIIAYRIPERIPRAGSGMKTKGKSYAEGLRSPAIAS